MKVRCLYNTGKDIRAYETKPLSKNELGRFRTTENTQFGIDIDKEYIVMGIILGEGTLSYLIDDGGYISAYPFPLLEVIEPKLSSHWFFRSLKNTDKKYPYQEALWGYYEFVFDVNHFEKLVECDEETMRIYFRRKIEFEKELAEDQEYR